MTKFRRYLVLDKYALLMIGGFRKTRRKKKSERGYKNFQ